MCSRAWQSMEFLSTPSARRATNREKEDHCAKVISIHALREEGDRSQRPAGVNQTNFYPRPPRGGRQLDGLPVCSAVRFLSTPSARRATSSGQFGPLFCLFLSTPSARRATRCRAYDNSIDEDFYPRPPRGGRRLLGGAAVVNDGISIHALREEGDAGRCRNTYLPGYFYPRPPRGGRLSSSSTSMACS